MSRRDRPRPRRRRGRPPPPGRSRHPSSPPPGRPPRGRWPRRRPPPDGCWRGSFEHRQPQTPPLRLTLRRRVRAETCVRWFRVGWPRWDRCFSWFHPAHPAIAVKRQASCLRIAMFWSATPPGVVYHDSGRPLQTRTHGWKRRRVASESHGWIRGMRRTMMPVRERASGILCAVLALFLGATMVSCSPSGCRAGAGEEPDWSDLRERMVRQQIETRGVKDPAVLAAMRSVPRHTFVPDDYREASYQDSPLPIGESQTISQPYIVALMSELLEVKTGRQGARDRHRLRLSSRGARGHGGGGLHHRDSSGAVQAGRDDPRRPRL